jgi:hypothetical protein
MPMPRGSLDVFELLASAPDAFLAPGRGRRARLRAALSTSGVRALPRIVAGLVERFQRVYRKLRGLLAAPVPPHARRSMFRRMARAARLGNKPMPLLYRPELYAAAWRVLEAYVQTERPEPVARLIDDTIRASLPIGLRRGAER